MQSEDFKKELARELYLKLLFEGEGGVDSRKKEDFVRLAEMAVDAANAFATVYDGKRPKKPFTPKSYLK